MGLAGTRHLHRSPVNDEGAKAAPMATKSYHRSWLDERTRTGMGREGEAWDEATG
jgi:hypothetical protein